MGSWVKTIVGRKSSNQSKITSSRQENASHKEKQKGWGLWKNSGPVDKESSQHVSNEEGAVIPCDSPCLGSSVDEHSTAEQAAIRIQSAFRGFLARKSLHALKRLARLQETIKGRNGYKQSIASVHAIRDFVRIQAQIHSQRASKRLQAPVGPQKPAGNAVLPCTKGADTEADWCHAAGTVEEIQSRIQQRQEAAIKRERALAYAFSNQQRRNSKFKSECFLDYDLDSSTWNWISLDQWISGVTQRSHTDKGSSNVESQTRNKVILKKPSSVRRTNPNSQTFKRIHESNSNEPYNDT